MASVDISIRGAGIFGLCIAWTAVKAGARVELVDPNGTASGASGGIVGALAPHVPENWNPKKQFQLESLLRTQGFWNEITEISGQDTGYRRHGRIQPIAKGGVDLARARCDGAKTRWGGHATWAVTTDPEGWSLTSDSGFYIKDTLSAHIHPRKACLALATALRHRGVPVIAEPKASASATVWATGAAGLDALSRNRPRPMGQGIKGQAALLKYAKPNAPNVFADTVHIIPHSDGTVAIGSTTERDYSNGQDTDTLLDSVIARARAAVPELKDADVVTRWAGLRPRARSRAPMLGPWPEKPGHFIANGGFKIGFGMAVKSADVMVDLILQGRDAIPDGFRVTDNF